MARVAIGVEIADGDRVDARASEPRDRRLERAPVESGVATLPSKRMRSRHAEAARARHERDGRRHAEVVAVVLEPLAHLDDVAVALGGEHADRRALALEQGVGRDRRAVDDELGVGQQRRRSVPSSAARRSRPSITPIDGSAGVEADLARRHAPFVVHGDEIGEGAADVDADAEHRQRPRRRGARAVRPVDEAVVEVGGARRRVAARGRP